MLMTPRISVIKYLQGRRELSHCPLSWYAMDPLSLPSVNL